jgi:chemotaxis protein methyltransferase CheR
MFQKNKYINTLSFKLSDRHFRQYCRLVYEECGIILNEDKRALLSARLSRRLRRLQLTADKYLARIQADPDERDRFVDAISTNHTFFFREPDSFRYIHDRCRDIWCAASSRGEEPYSLAAYCHSRGINPSILATDISESCLDKGRNGVYPIESSRFIPTRILKQCFQRGVDPWHGYLRIRPTIKGMVRFSRFNLLSDPVPDRHFDMVFCRNVMIYFDRQTKEKVVRKLCHVLRRGGYFIVGRAESLNGLAHALSYEAPSVYRKK